MESVISSPEKKEMPPIETVRIAVFYRGKFLILQKNKTARNPLSWEFPGGKVDHKAGDVATLQEQFDTVKKELFEETGIDIAQERLPVEHIEDFKLRYETILKPGKLKSADKGLVHLFLITVPKDLKLNIKVDQTKNSLGYSEDNHDGYFFLSPKQLLKKLKFKENPVTKKRSISLTRPSRNLRKLFEKVGAIEKRNKEN